MTDGAVAGHDRVRSGPLHKFIGRGRDDGRCSAEENPRSEEVNIMIWVVKMTSPAVFCTGQPVLLMRAEAVHESNL
ncbi:hypothetical protein J6590_071052 [Homalodisca vitripennis]|nr:hypothetical protein J6590_071052 [Homalodisca vitripennis]